MIRAGQLNATASLTRDHDLGSFGYSLWKDLPGGGGVVEGLAVTTNSVALGRALVNAIRTSTTPNEKFLMHVELTTAETIDTTGTKKIWLEPIAARVNDPSLNTAADGSGIAQITTGADWPTTPHIRLATTSSGVITDARVFTKTVAEAARDRSFNAAAATGTAAAYVLTLPIVPASLSTFMQVEFTSPAQNTAGVTLNVNGLGAKTLKLPDGTTDVPAGFILLGQLVHAQYDGTNFRVVSAPYTGYQKASGAEVETGTDDAKFVTALGLRSIKASDAEILAGVQTDRYATAAQASKNWAKTLTDYTASTTGAAAYTTAWNPAKGGLAVVDAAFTYNPGVSGTAGFQVSDDGSSWTTIWTRTVGTGSGANFATASFTYMVRPGQYVRASVATGNGTSCSVTLHGQLLS
jgi:hypothetical protein